MTEVTNKNDPALRISALVFANGTVSMECEFESDAFWMQLGIAVGYGLFVRTDPTAFLLQQVHSDCSRSPFPLVSVRRVLWSRQAAREADQSIGAYQAAVDQMP